MIGIGGYREQTSLTREQKEAIGLLSIGTFLEYFDLMLYVHMAVLLNDLFFEPSDPYTASLIAAFAFCSTFIFRPIGALIFGYLGDHIGRKPIVIITTLMMSISCVVMANLPTYAQVGVTASCLITICRIVQGVSSMEEVVAAEIYLTESINPPIQYPAVSLVSVFSTFGGVAALGIASLVTTYTFNWRIAFWIGAGIAMIGVVARTRLKETRDFSNAKLNLQKTWDQFHDKVHIDRNKLKENSIYQEKINKKTLLALFLLECMCPVWFYFTYIYCGNLLKTSFGYTSEEVIRQNFVISMFSFSITIVLTYLSYRIYPLKIAKTLLLIFTVFVVTTPYVLYNINTGFDIFLIQLFVTLFVPVGPGIGRPIFFKYFPVFKRFTCTSLAFAISRALMYVVTSFAIVYLTEHYNNWGIIMIWFPVCIGFAFGLFHFEKLEKESGSYPIS